MAGPAGSHPDSGRRRRAGGALVALIASLAAIGGVIALIAVLNDRDAPGVEGVSSGPGQAARDLGREHLRAGERGPARYSSVPPTSGAHVPARVSASSVGLSDDQLLHALELGNVVLAYPPGPAPPVLRALADDVAGAFSPGLAAGGQAVILMPRAGVAGAVALAWGRLQRASTPQDPRLREFAEFWLGRGAR